MNITVIYATSRKTKSCTYGIAQLLLKELLGDGRLYEFYLPKDMPHVCTGCYGCFMGKEEKCGGAAALAPILSAMEQSDLIIFCVPTYVFHAPGQVKSFLDHFGYRWMVHRPDLSFMKKQAVIINTAGGGGMKSTVKDVKDSMDYWGVVRTHVISQKVWNYDWTTLPESFRREAEEKVRKTAKNVRKRAAHLTPCLKVKILFYLFRFLHKNRKMTPVDDEYWMERGYTEGNYFPNKSL